jgi:hypothetical protein
VFDVDLDMDVLHVRFDTSKVTVKAMLELIAKEGFQAKIISRD